MTPSPEPLLVQATVVDGSTDPLWLVLPPILTFMLGIGITALAAWLAQRRATTEARAARKLAIADRRAVQHEATLREIQEIVLEQNEALLRFVIARDRIPGLFWHWKAYRVTANGARLVTIGTRSFDERLGHLIDAANEAASTCVSGGRLGLDGRHDAAITAIAAVASRAGDLLRELYPLDGITPAAAQAAAAEP